MRELGAPPAPLRTGELGAAVEAIAARATDGGLKRASDQCPVPILILDGRRRYLYANQPARLAFHLSLDELRRLRVEDLTPERMLPTVDPTWERFIRAGVLTGTYEIATLDGGIWEVVYYAVTSRAPGRHVIGFSPAGWPDNELNLSATDRIEPVAISAEELTTREREVVGLLAHGLTGEEIAARLQVSPETVRTHIRNALRRMGAKTRAHLVALVFGVPDNGSRPD